ncbi:MFS transporter [Lentilactobacillus curieae]|uniref:MFS transporter n=1 Tax=Lentilactobacillus curieae TaxID=1138822 RepID=A0A1S6QFV7_9LACO|nr:MFS transporter [Lentilactobacillus curieae]AQW20495.1 MFS transporter [Lentilactobacillus curieae]
MDKSISIAIWRKNILIFLTSQFLTGITSMIVQYAIIWYLTKETGSATVLSLATLLGMLPMALLSPFAGPFVDRLNKKALLIVPDLIAALFAILLSIVGTINSTFPLWLVFVSLLVRSIAQTFQMPTVQSILPTMVPEKELTKINGQLGMVQSANMIIAPALGAFLFSIVPINFLILIDVIGAVISVGLLIFVVIPNNKITEQKLSILSDVKFGLGKLVKNRGVMWLTIIGAIFTLLLMPAASLYPLMTMDYFKGSVFQAGMIEVIYSAGMLLGGAIIGFFGNWKNRMTPVVLSYLVIGITFAWSGILPDSQTGYWYFLILNAIGGLATPFFNTLMMAMIQQSYPSNELGRVLGILNAILSIAGPVGLIFAGPLADSIGVEKMFLIAGIGTVLCGLANWLIPTARNYDIKLQATLAEKNEK